MIIKCEFFNKVDLGELPEKPDWEFENMNCKIESETGIAATEFLEQNGKSFFLQKTISYGDFLIVAFLTILFCGLAISFIRDFAKNRKLERL